MADCAHALEVKRIEPLRDVAEKQSQGSSYASIRRHADSQLPQDPAVKRLASASRMHRVAHFLYFGTLRQGQGQGRVCGGLRSMFEFWSQQNADAGA